MLLKLVPNTKEESLRKEFARDKRSSPYLGAFSILLAFIIQSLAKWFIELVSAPLPAQLQGASADKVVTLWVNLSVPYLLIALVFFYAIYFWLFFSRVLIYIEENEVGELMSFALAAAILAVISLLPKHLDLWPLLLSIPSSIVSLKLIQLKRRAVDEADKALRPIIARWYLWTISVTVALILLGVFVFPWEGKTVGVRIWINAIVPMILLIGGFRAVFKAAASIQVEIEQIVEAAIRQHPSFNGV